MEEAEEERQYWTLFNLEGSGNQIFIVSTIKNKLHPSFPEFTTLWVTVTSVTFRKVGAHP